jgi:hypothetical protein
MFCFMHGSMGLFVTCINFMCNSFVVIELFQVPVSSFKEKIANEIGIPVGQQRLIFRGRVLKDDHLLSEYRIQTHLTYRIAWF